MDRRQFCKSAFHFGLLSTTASLFSSPAFSWAQNALKPQFMVFVRMEGGWDASLALDPWIPSARPSEKDFFIEYRPEELLTFGNSFLGPATEPLKKYFDRMTVINGIFVTANDGGHESAALYNTSGNGQGKLGVLPLELEGLGFHSPFGTLSDTVAYSGTKSKSVWDLTQFGKLNSLSGADMLIDFGDKQTEISKARLAMLSHGGKISHFNSLFSKFSGDDKIYGALSSAFGSGLSQTAFISIRENLDTHSAHEKTHKNLLTTGFSKLTKLIDILSVSAGVHADLSEDLNQSLLDQTTVVVTSEFTRTPALNGSQGKDHNSQCNSALIISPKMKSMTVGASTLITRAQSKSGTSYLAGLPLHTTTLLPVMQRQDSFILRPENVMATIARSLGVDPSSISEDLGKARVLSSILK